MHFQHCLSCITTRSAINCTCVYKHIIIVHVNILLHRRQDKLKQLKYALPNNENQEIKMTDIDINKSTMQVDKDE